MEILEIIALVLAFYPFKSLYYLYRISLKRNSATNQAATIVGGLAYLLALVMMPNVFLQFGLIALASLTADWLVKKYMKTINKEYCEEFLDKLEEAIKAHKESQRKNN